MFLAFHTRTKPRECEQKGCKAWPKHNSLGKTQLKCRGLLREIQWLV